MGITGRKTQTVPRMFRHIQHNVAFMVLANGLMGLGGSVC